MRVLLDTCVLAELRHPKGQANVKKAIATIPDDNLYISVISIGEINKGIALLPPSKKQQELGEWLQILKTHYADRILAIDSETTHIWGELTAMAQNNGHIIPASDGLIAATARQHGLYIMTRNTKDFAPSGAMLINPWLNG